MPLPNSLKQSEGANSKTTRRSHAERVELSDARMFEAAIQLIDEQGTEKTTLKDVGEKAGYSRGLAGSRFKSKSGLFCFVIKRVGEYWLDEMKKATQGLSGYAAMAATTDAHYHFCRLAPRQVRVFYLLWFEALGTESEVQTVVMGIHRRRHADVAAWIRKDMEDGVLSADLDAEAIAHQFLNTVIGIIYQWLMNPGRDEDYRAQHEHLKTTMRLLLGVSEDSNHV